MKKIVKLTENDLMKLIESSILEQNNDVELNEQGFLRGFFRNVKNAKELKVLDAAMFGAFDDVIKFGVKRGEQVNGITKVGSVSHVPIKNVDELITAVKEGLQPKELGKFYSGLLKSSNTPRNVLNDLAKELVSSEKFIKSYGKMSEKDLRLALQKRKYSTEGIEAIVAETKTNKTFKLAKTNTAQRQTINTKNQKIGSQAKDIEDFKKAQPELSQIKNVEDAKGAINIEINMTQGGAAGVNGAVQGVKEIAPEVKAIAEESKTLVDTMKPSKWEKFKKIASRLNMKYIIALGLAGIGGWYLWKFFKGGTTKPGDMLFGKCLDDVIDDNGTTIKNTTGGDPVVIVKKTNNSEYDGKGGLWFFNNGRVFMADQTKRGRWSCKGTQTVVAEQGDGNPNTGIGNINISWDGETSPIKKGGGGSSDNGGGGTKTNVNYHDCSTKDFPFEFGCVSPKIAEIQKCLGITPQKGNFGPKTKKGLEDLHYDLTNGITKDAYDKIIAACNPTTGSTTGSTVTGTTTGTTVTPVKPQPIVPPPTPAEPVFDKNRLQELLASKNLVKKRKGVIVKWKGPELDGNDYYILDKYLIDKGYIQKKQRETGDKDDEDVTMKYKWKLQGEE